MKREQKRKNFLLEGCNNTGLRNVHMCSLFLSHVKIYWFKFIVLLLVKILWYKERVRDERDYDDQTKKGQNGSAKKED